LRPPFLTTPLPVNAFSVMPLVREAAGARVLKIPAPPACYWLGLLEVEAAGRQQHDILRDPVMERPLHARRGAI
jgi:hypothetical protein